MNDLFIYLSFFLGNVKLRGRSRFHPVGPAEPRNFALAQQNGKTFSALASQSDGSDDQSGGDDEDGNNKPMSVPWQWTVSATNPFNTSYSYNKSLAEGSWKDVTGYRDEGATRTPLEFKTFALKNGVVSGEGQDPLAKFTLAGTYRLANGDRPGDPSWGDVILFYQKYLGQYYIKYTGVIGRMDKSRKEDKDKYYVEGTWYHEWSMGFDTGNFYLKLA